MNKWKWIVGTVVAITFLTVVMIVGLMLGHRKMSKSEIPRWMTEAMKNVRHIAIIGAGAAGSSAAFFLHKQLLTLACRDKVEITVYEKESRVGGRAAIIHPYNDSKYDPVEIGASIYVSANLHLVQAIKQFNLSSKFHEIDDNHVTYVYDGKRMLADMDYLATRYNPLSLMKMEMLTGVVIQRFLRLYQRSWQLLKGPFRTVEAYAEAIDLKPRINESGFTFLVNNGVDEVTVNELADSITQGTYGQQVTQLHAVMTLIAMAGRGNSIEGGNYKIFENMIKASLVKLKINQKVTKISKNMRNGKWIITTAESSNKYDIVILATPPHHSNIDLINIRDEITKVNYIQRYVTLFTTNATHLGSSYMKMAIPISLLVTRNLERQNGANDLNLNVEAMSFSTFLYPRKERLVKLFSPIYLDDSKLAEIVDGRANVGWVYRKMWYAYPRAPPRNNTIFPLINPDKGFYYVNAFESFISTMETQCLAAHNIIRLLLADYGYDEKAATVSDDYWIDTTN